MLHNAFFCFLLCYFVLFCEYEVAKHIKSSRPHIFLTNPLIFDFYFDIIYTSCGYISSVECDLPKVERWVRLPLPAPKKGKSPRLLPFLFLTDQKKISQAHRAF